MPPDDYKKHKEKNNKNNIKKYNLYKLIIKKSNSYHSADVYAVAENIKNVVTMFDDCAIHEVTLIEERINVKL